MLGDRKNTVTSFCHNGDGSLPQVIITLLKVVRTIEANKSLWLTAVMQQLEDLRLLPWRRLRASAAELVLLM